MPILSTETSASAEGYGFARGVSAGTVIYTFPSGTSTWTAPGGVTTLNFASGKGADGYAGGWVSSPTYPLCSSDVTAYATSNSGSPLDWSVPYGEVLSFLSTVNVGAPANRLITSTYVYRSVDPSNNVVYDFTLYYPNTSTRGTATGPYAYIGNPQVSGQILYSQGTSYWSVLGDYYDPGGVGTSTTGFGLTFPGGSYTAASTTTFNNVSVTPGTTYTIVNNGSLTIQYIG